MLNKPKGYIITRSDEKGRTYGNRFRMSTKSSLIIKANFVVKIGSLDLDIESGKWRYLTQEEENNLLHK